MFLIRDTFPSFSLPSFRVPNLNFNLNLPLRRGSTQAGGRTFVGFARFRNERVSTINIGQTSSVTRGEPVDESLERIDATKEEEEEKVTQVVADAGFTNVTYDLVGVSDGIELIPKDADSRMASTSTSTSTLTVTPTPTPVGPPKPMRLGLGQEGRTITLEPIYGQVFDVSSGSKGGFN